MIVLSSLFLVRILELQLSSEVYISYYIRATSALSRYSILKPSIGSIPITQTSILLSINTLSRLAILVSILYTFITYARPLRFYLRVFFLVDSLASFSILFVHIVARSSQLITFAFPSIINLVDCYIFALLLMLSKNYICSY